MLSLLGVDDLRETLGCLRINPILHFFFFFFFFLFFFFLVKPKVTKGRFTLWTMKSSHGRLSDVIGR
jgi:hypothetical protein